MPTYLYRCNEGHTFTRYAPMAQATEKAQCPACGQMAERVISPPMLKHDGAYSHRPTQEAA